MDPNTVNPQPAAPAPVAGPAPVPPPAPPAVVPVPPYVERKSPGLAGLLSVMPGLGHLYLGLYNRAFMIAGAWILAIFLTSRGGPGEFFGLAIAFLWFFGIIDAVRQARAINLGIVTESGYAPSEQLRKATKGTAGLFWGVVLVGIGTLWLLDRYVEIDWSFMEDWGTGLALVVLGLILIVSHVRKSRADNANGTGMPPRST